MFRIDLKDIEIYAYHGVLPEENIIGSTYIVNLSVWANLQKAAETDLVSDTISYADLNEIIISEMKIKSNLLEHLCFRISEKIHFAFPQIHKLEISIGKVSPPMPGKLDQARVIYSQNFL